MQDLLGIGTNRRESMIGVGIGLGLAGYRLNPPGVLPVLDLRFAQDKSLTAFAGPTPSFSRASSGTYFDASGVLQSAGVNAARFNHTFNGTSWVSRGLLVEEQRTNIWLQSNNLNTSPWVQANNTTTESAAPSPDGSSSAASVVPNTTNATHYTYQVITTSAITYSVSFYAKANGYNFIQLSSGMTNDYVNFNLSTGTVGNKSQSENRITSHQIQSIGNGWYRCSAIISSIGSTHDYGIAVINADTASRRPAFAGDGTSGVLLYGFQMEAGSFATSLISTTSSSTTRSADVCQITGADFSGFWNATEGAIAVESDSPATGTRPISSADDNTANESAILFTSGTDPKFSVTDGGVSQADIDAGSISANTNFKLSLALKTNDFAASIGGVAAITDTSGTVPTVDRLRIGADQAGNYLNGHIARLRYYRTRLENGTLRVLST